MITFRNWSRFFSTTSARKYQLDVGELRAAFAWSDSIAERMKGFRVERISRIVGDDLPVSLDPGSRVEQNGQVIADNS